MVNFFRIFLVFALIMPLTACGVKGKLKSPDQIEKMEAKKAAEAQEKAEEELKEKIEMEKDGAAE